MNFKNNMSTGVNKMNVNNTSGIPNMFWDIGMSQNRAISGEKQLLYKFIGLFWLLFKAYWISGLARA